MTAGRPDRWEVLGAGAWTLSLAFFVIQGVAQAASARPFSLQTNLISDLGNTACGREICSPLLVIANSAMS